MARLVSLLVLLTALAGCGEPSRRPSFVLIVVDTLRADALGCGGNPDAATPSLDALAASGLQFRTCVSQAPWTLPATATILTGRIPSAHGANRLQRAVAPGVPLLAENLRSSSYRTGAFVANHFLQERYGLQRGFDHFDETQIGDETAVTSEALTTAALDWVRSDTKPFFLFVFYMDPHYAYMSHPGFTPPAGDYAGAVTPGRDIWELREMAPELGPADAARLRDLYRGEVRATDRAIGRLLDGLVETGEGRNAFVLFTADHGEELLERDWIGHTRDLHRELLDVPFFVSGSRWIRPELREDPAMLIDVFPTVLQCLGLAPTRIPGRGLVQGDRGERPLYAEVSYDPQAIPPQDDAGRERDRLRELRKIANSKSLQLGDWKAIRNGLTGAWELYDLGADPGETSDVAAAHPEELERLESALPEPGAFDVPEGEATAGMSEEDRERLRGLGYVR